MNPAHLMKSSSTLNVSTNTVSNAPEDITPPRSKMELHLYKISSVPILHVRPQSLSKIEVVEDETFSRLLVLLLNSHLNEDKDVKWCPHCGVAVVLSQAIGQIDNKISCPHCQNQFCSECSNQWHEGACQGPEIDRKFLKWKRKNDVRQCPKCKFFIQRIFGCSDMHCSRCHHRFCWKCGSPRETTRQGTKHVGICRPSKVDPEEKFASKYPPVFRETLNLVHLILDTEGIRRTQYPLEKIVLSITGGCFLLTLSVPIVIMFSPYFVVMTTQWYTSKAIFKLRKRRNRKRLDSH